MKQLIFSLIAVFGITAMASSQTKTVSVEKRGPVTVHVTHTTPAPAITTTTTSKSGPVTLHTTRTTPVVAATPGVRHDNGRHLGQYKKHWKHKKRKQIREKLKDKDND